MADVTQEELDQLQADNEKLREQIVAEEARRAENHAKVQRENQAAQLKAEKAILESRLDAVKAEANVTTAREATADVVAQAKEQAKAAEAQRDARVAAAEAAEAEKKEN